MPVSPEAAVDEFLRIFERFDVSLTTNHSILVMIWMQNVFEGIFTNLAELCGLRVGYLKLLLLFTSYSSLYTATKIGLDVS